MQSFSEHLCCRTFTNVFANIFARKKISQKTSTSVTCIDAQGEITVECEDPDTSTTRSDTKIFGGGFGASGFGGGFGGWGGGGFSADITECDADQVHVAMTNLIRDLEEYGCKENDEMVFTQVILVV